MSTSVLASDTSLFFSPTADRTLDITAGAHYEDTDLYVYNNGTTYKITVTYYNTSTVALTSTMFIRFKWNGTRWIIQKESRIGKIEHGYIIPRGGAELNGGLRTKDALWKYIQEYYTSYIITETNWQLGDCAKFADYDTNQYRLPDFRGLFERNAGTNSKRQTSNNTYFTGGDVSSILNDAFQSHYHLGGYNTGGNAGINGWGSFTEFTKTNMITGSSTVTTYPGIVGVAYTDFSNGDPRASNETRPVAVSLTPYIYYED
jgi:hypothetical protein